VKRFEIAAAYVLGIILPVLEAARRRTNFENIPAYVDDFIIGALLLWAARSASGGRPYGRALLAAVWGILCGGLWGSFFGQLENSAPTDISGLANGVVVFVKGVVYVIALVALFLSVRRATGAEPGAGQQQ
jgi:hypothetical protein